MRHIERRAWWRLAFADRDDFQGHRNGSPEPPRARALIVRQYSPCSSVPLRAVRCPGFPLRGKMETMNGRATALALVLCGAMIAEGVVAEDRKHTEPREPRDTVANHLFHNPMAARRKPMMRPILREMLNGVVGGTFMYEVSYSLVDKVQIIRHVNRGTDWQLCWQVRRITGGVCGEWTGKFASSEEAYQLAA